MAMLRVSSRPRILALSSSRLSNSPHSCPLALLFLASFCRIVVLSFSLHCRPLALSNSQILGFSTFSLSRILVLSFVLSSSRILVVLCIVVLSFSRWKRKHLNPIPTILVIPRCRPLENPRRRSLH